MSDNQPTYFFNGVTLLVTHYNRSNSLERLLKKFTEYGCSFEDIVVSDDGSKPEQVSRLKELQGEYPFRLITTEKNKGLGNNINKGQDAIKTPLTLYVQEDFEPIPQIGKYLKNAAEIINQRDDLDIVRFYAYFKYPKLKPFRSGFSEMIFSPFQPKYRKFYAYSDHPHLRRDTFLKKFGRYTEGVKGDVTEYNMMMSFLKKGGKGLFYEKYQSLFEQKNSSDEPSTMKRDVWRESENVLITGIRHLYRHLKFNYDLFLSGKFS